MAKCHSHMQTAEVRGEPFSNDRSVEYANYIQLAFVARFLNNIFLCGAAAERGPWPRHS